MSRIRTTAFALAGTLLLAACGGEEPQTPGNLPEQQTPAPDQHTPAPDGAEQPADHNDVESAPMRTVESGVKHEWPPISVDSSGPTHVVVMEGPDPGWTLELDGLEPGDGHTTAFVTVRRPEPGTMQPQVITERRADTGTPAAKPMRIAVRVAAVDGSLPESYRALAPDE